MARPKDKPGPNEPSYTPKGLRWVYWSDLGSDERLEFRREREPELAEVEAWLHRRGWTIQRTGS